MMQIRELILYGNNGAVRHLPFRLGTVNIISGKSGSGKTAIGDIIDYCLGGDSCNIADGIIRENVSWYGLLLQLDNERLFVARKNPPIGQQSSSTCYIEIGERIEAPMEGGFSANHNVASLEETLSRRLGIAENLNIPPEGQSRHSLAANVRHSLFYCFQRQDEIASQSFLFHRQQEDHITQAIKDTLPYFLGIINEENLALENERGILKRRLAIEKRKLEELMMLQGGGLDRAISLISESRQVGLLPKDLVVDYDDYDAVSDVLRSVNEWTPIDLESIGMDRLTYLQAELIKQENDLDDLSIEITNARTYAGETSGFTDAAQHQVIRLSSIGLFEQLDFNPGHCPLCSSEMQNPLPNTDMIRKSINNLNENIASVTRERPKIRDFISALEMQRQKLREKIQQIKSEIDGVYAQNQESSRLRDLTARRARIVGRISLWLESMQRYNSSSGKENTIGQIENRIHEIDDLLDRDSLEERKTSILSRISVDMSNWAKELQLENGDNPYRLDMNKVTVMVDKADRPVPLRQLGSGSNWVGIHLITCFALHKFFVSANRPVPNFLFLDQPSQVYFPSEIEEKRTDWGKVSELYRFIFSRTIEMNARLQVIIVDHADLKDITFRDAVIEDWWTDKYLVPEEWYKKQ